MTILTKETRRKSEEIFELIFKALTDEPQSIGKIVKKTGLNWRTINDYVRMIQIIQEKKRIRVTENPTLVWYVED